MNKKQHKYKLNKTSYKLSRNYKITYGNFGVKSIYNGIINFRNIENLRRKLSKQLKKLNNINKTKIFIKLNNWKPYTNKPMLSRMGKGAGPITRWNTLIKKGIIFFELSTIEKQLQIKQIFKKAIRNFPIKLILVKK